MPKSEECGSDEAPAEVKREFNITEEQWKMVVSRIDKLEDETITQHRQIEHLEDIIQCLRKELKLTKEETMRLTKEKGKLMEDVNKYKRKIETLEQTNKDLLVQNKRLKIKMKASNGKRSTTLGRELSESKAKIAKLSMDCENLRTTIETLRRDNSCTCM